MACLRLERVASVSQACLYIRHLLFCEGSRFCCRAKGVEIRGANRDGDERQSRVGYPSLHPHLQPNESAGFGQQLQASQRYQLATRHLHGPFRQGFLSRPRLHACVVDGCHADGCVALMVVNIVKGFVSNNFSLPSASSLEQNRHVPG